MSLTAQSSRCRCQLFRDHNGRDHAVMICTGDWVYSRGTGKTQPKQVIRWGAHDREVDRPWREVSRRRDCG